MEAACVRETLFVDFDAPTAIAWSANGNLIAVAFPHRDQTTARVILLEPDVLHVLSRRYSEHHFQLLGVPQEHTVLEIPLQSPSDFVAFLSFSPPHASLTLITATKQGKILLWTPRQNSHTYQPVALNTWAAEHVMLAWVREEVVFDLYRTLGGNRNWTVGLLSVSLAAFVLPMAT